ncbi:hypothetical protein BEWA_018120 [Theileria equi strain WA]|uniref:Uncharacterized protein n=1 Tax=Theileria equi strain WA TaxID=1537102 RepID=L0AVR0_THEEQ|nr:hypothetical protein BEWA_018120 [Theileria equi strain WA]AFZ78969.1 hypothetical protein BEWA_018120 [Theileria equi strain WA]|eukprot:XP_004828635.1 hypothetical protein BEWA_018120 [Theileria equi strain WA]
MTYTKRSAAYFAKTEAVTEFLVEFVRVRKAFLDSNKKECAGRNSPYRRSKSAKRGGKNLSHRDDHDLHNDNLSNVATQMLADSDIHLDAFISLVAAYGAMEKEQAKIQKFELSKILRNTRITHRKFPKVEHGYDIATSKRIAQELEYQRQTKDIREAFSSKTNLHEFKPPIM